MRLKTLEVNGFKSFADKTVLEFCSGINAIVGPNGCGKSNIADAFRWVLGEQSAKSMRGNKMPDVIFSGTAQRSAVNIAEVTITLTDVAGQLPIAYEEVAVTRRLYRDGESQYLINRQPVRLKDVQDLFLDSGIGKDTFSIFEQGKIDQLIQHSPLERRYIFEEAAGILRFLQRKREALRKLEQVDLNLSRVRDIYLEVEKQIVVLEEQAEQAKIFKNNKAKLEELEKTLYVIKWDLLQKKHDALWKKEREHQQLLLQVSTNLEKRTQENKDVKLSLNESERLLRAQNETLFQLRSEKQLKAQEKLSHEERLHEHAAKVVRWQHELVELSKKRQQRELERKELNQKKQELDQRTEEQKDTIEEQKERTKKAEKSIARLRESQQKSQQQKMQLFQQEARQESECKQLKIRLETLSERETAIKERQENLEKLILELTSHIHDRKKEMNAIALSIDEQRAALVEQEAQIQTVLNAIQETRHVLTSTQQEIAEVRARLKVLERMRDDNEGFSAGSKLLLQESVNPKSPLHGFLRGLYEFIIPVQASETALAVLLRPYMQTLVVETRAQLHTVLEFAKQRKLKEFSLLCLEELPSHSQKALSKLPSALHMAVEHPLSKHFLKQTFEAANLEQALHQIKETPGAVCITPDGFVIDSYGSIVFTTPGEQNPFIREAELKNLSEKCSQLIQQQENGHSILKSQQQKLESLQTDRLTIDKSIRRDEMKSVEINFGLQRLNADMEKGKKENQLLSSELNTISRSQETLTEQLNNISQTLAATKTQSQELLEQDSNLRADIERDIGVFKQEQLRLQDIEKKQNDLSDELRKILHSLQIIDIHESESLRQETILKEELAHSDEVEQKITQQRVEVDRILITLENSLSKATSNLADTEKAVLKKKESMEEREHTAQNERTRLAKMEEELKRLELQKEQLASTRKHLSDELQDRYQLPIEELYAALVPPGSILDKTAEPLERQIRSLRQSMESAGNINFASIEEYEKLKLRYEFLTQQMADLESSKQELVQIISKLDEESRVIFKEAFEVIRSNFKRNFQILFNGGEADLQFTETGDVLEAGVEVIAKPPGKQMRSIGLLSGGEKCLTAMALLFAIFEVKPAPFCILDEIDAPLDDTNVERFTNVVKQFIDRCQFLIITHNKRTMSIADVLWGVSMQERGVSKVLAIEFKREPALRL